MNQGLRYMLISIGCLTAACFIVSAIETFIKRDDGHLEDEDYRVLSGKNDEMEKNDEN